MLKPSTFAFLVAVTVCLIRTSNSEAQTRNIYEWFDSATGKTNTSIYNGPIYYNLYRTREASNNPFLGMDEYSTGDVNYDGQPYFGIKMKYDISRDLLLVQPVNGENNRSVQLITDKVASFSLLGKKFINLSFDQNGKNRVKGFYEESVTSDNFTLFIKHHKSVREIISGQSLFNDYSNEYEYVVRTAGDYKIIGSKRDIIAVFPNLKEQINKYYSSNSKNNGPQFMEGLFRYIQSIPR